MARPVEELIDHLLQCLRAKLLARRGTVEESEKLIIEAYRREDDSYDITLTGKSR
jgi:hypothetical protein